MPINRQAVSKYVKDQRYMVSLEKSENQQILVQQPHASTTTHQLPHVSSPNLQFSINNNNNNNSNKILPGSQSPVLSKLITYEINNHNNKKGTNHHAHTYQTKNTDEGQIKPRERAQTAGNPSRPTLTTDDHRKAATLGPLPRSPLLNKKQISQSDLEKELKRMYGGLPTKTNDGHHHDGHSEFCSCKAKGCNY